MAERTTFGASTGPEWDRLIVALGIVNKEMPERFALTLERTAHSAARRVQIRALFIPARKHPTGKMRGTISRGIEVRKQRHTHGSGWRVVATMPRGLEMLPRGFASQWSHPVFGHGWTLQQSHDDWFIGPIGREYGTAFRRMRKDIENALEDVDRMAGGRR